MFFFNDECDFRDDEQYDWFTLTTQIERQMPSYDRCLTGAAPSTSVAGGIRQAKIRRRKGHPDL
jgi:hypothetical protein